MQYQYVTLHLGLQMEDLKNRFMCRETKNNTVLNSSLKCLFGVHTMIHNLAF